MRISRKTFYNLGGFASSEVYRRMNSKGWSYYSKSENLNAVLTKLKLAKTRRDIKELLEEA